MLAHSASNRSAPTFDFKARTVLACGLPFLEPVRSCRCQALYVSASVDAVLPTFWLARIGRQTLSFGHSLLPVQIELGFMKHNFDFSLLPADSAFEARSILIGLPKDLRKRLEPLPQALERAESAAMFAAQSGKNTEPWRAAAFLRAALADYCAMEEVQAMDQPGSPSFKITDTRNPLLHLLKLVRHLSIHVKTVAARPYLVSAKLGEHEFQLNVFVFTNLDSQDLITLRNGKNYDLADLEKSVAWFNSMQEHWGAGDLIFLGTKLFAEQVCLHHSL